ncbi:unnamed protein product [Paramecium sonneborni]|uniref:Uncharacterized protein n=1 Tax=Paramecium sonneborni TaxID=65129 RepID=A0A8S1R7H5_9CILI|nr:unnamed protein product [Paramecium sonneborni]
MFFNNSQINISKHLESNKLIKQYKCNILEKYTQPQEKGEQNQQEEQPQKQEKPPAKNYLDLSNKPIPLNSTLIHFEVCINRQKSHQFCTKHDELRYAKLNHEFKEDNLLVIIIKFSSCRGCYSKFILCSQPLKYQDIHRSNNLLQKKHRFVSCCSSNSRKNKKISQ